jgi:hypothetical protein
MQASRPGLINCHEDLFYGVRFNPAVAIFQTFATQMIGYGFAGICKDIYAVIPFGHRALTDSPVSTQLPGLSNVVSTMILGATQPLPTKTRSSAFYPTYISVVSLLQSLHFGGLLNIKKRYAVKKSIF